jgi:hypothetical protein
MSAEDRQLYTVSVKGGGQFLYDLIDVGRFALRMAEQGDRRPITVKPWPRSRWRRRLAHTRDWLLTH